MPSYVVATVKPWNLDAFVRRAPALPGTWHLVERPENLTVASLNSLAPRFVFFPHWSWRVPADILERFECVCFHMTDVPYGRGGTPLQNLILRGHEATVLTALRMIDELDAGPVYLKRPLSLAGCAEDIFRRAAELVYDMISEIIDRQPVPTPQVGEPVIFRRRTPDESELPKDATAKSLYDFIRMLDAPTYPKAFLRSGELRLEFDRARFDGTSIEARVTIRAPTEATKS